VRGLEVGLGSAENWTSALPPEPLEVMCSHGAVLSGVEVHEHAAGAATATDPLPPVNGTLAVEEPRL
jgi:hypothetical protein